MEEARCWGRTLLAGRPGRCVAPGYERLVCLVGWLRARCLLDWRQAGFSLPPIASAARNDAQVVLSTEESLVKKGRHRRFEEARSLKRSVATDNRRCAECGAEPDDEHASWCMAEADQLDELLGGFPPAGAGHAGATAEEADPLDE